MRLVARLVLVTVLFSTALTVRAEPSEGFAPGRLSFGVTVKNIETDYRVLGLFVLPGERLTFQSASPLAIEAADGQVIETGRAPQWKAPARTGVYPVDIGTGGETMRFNVFVMRPARDVVNERLDGYRIGAYPSKLFRNLSSYRAPRGFVALTPDVLDTPVSPHFTLRQFQCKQETDGPRFQVLRESLLIKLERILEAINGAGIRTDGFVVMSGYRTPYYNRVIGNTTKYSRHVYGGAVDIFIDVAPRDGVMDDLDGDGQITKKDADFLYDLLEKFSNEPWWERARGGLSSYGATEAHGPFVHVDTRGYKARWGR